MERQTIHIKITMHYQQLKTKQMSNNSERERESECAKERGREKKRVNNSLFDTCRTFKDNEHKEHDCKK